MVKARQASGLDMVITVAKQPDNGTPPDFFHRFLFEEQLTPYAMFDIKAAAGDATKQVVEQRPVIVKERPEQVVHRKGNVLPAVGQDVLLFSNPLLSGLHATTAAGLRFTTLAEEA